MMAHVCDRIEASTSQKIESNHTEEELTTLFMKIDLEIESKAPKNRK